MSTKDKHRILLYSSIISTVYIIFLTGIVIYTTNNVLHIPPWEIPNNLILLPDISVIIGHITLVIIANIINWEALNHGNVEYSRRSNILFFISMILLFFSMTTILNTIFELILLLLWFIFTSAMVYLNYVGINKYYRKL